MDRRFSHYMDHDPKDDTYTPDPCEPICSCGADDHFEGECPQLAQNIMKRALPFVEAVAGTEQDECWPDANGCQHCDRDDLALSLAAVEATQGLEWEFTSWTDTAEWMRRAIGPERTEEEVRAMLRRLEEENEQFRIQQVR